MTDKFTCSKCGGTWEKAWSDEDAAEEHRQLFGHEPDRDAGVLCDDCFDEFMEWYAALKADPSSN